jgi:hypothetical protein
MATQTTSTAAWQIRTPPAKKNLGRPRPPQEPAPQHQHPQAISLIHPSKLSPSPDPRRRNQC